MRRQRRTNHGLTLVEVLISIVLMATLASACLPLIARATRLLHETAVDNRSPVPETDLGELGGLADALITDPKAFGFDELPTSGEFEVIWKNDAKWRHANVRIIQAASDESPIDHQWLEFRCMPEGDVKGPELRVYRWRHIELPEIADHARPPGGAP